MITKENELIFENELTTVDAVISRTPSLPKSIVLMALANGVKNWSELFKYIQSSRLAA